MNEFIGESVLSRRNFLSIAALGVAGMAGTARAVAVPATAAASPSVRPALMEKALAALQRHGAAIPNRDLIGIADFALPSGAPRFHLVDMANGRTTTLLVSHGKGSDPGHSGMLQRFSNAEGSEASSSGAYRTGEIYYGKHGRSRRLVGLDPTNCNAMERAIVVHGAWYVSPEIVRQHGKLGRSQGCLAVSQAELEQVITRLGTGRMIYADKI